MIIEKQLGDGVIALLFAGEGALNTLDTPTSQQLLEQVQRLMADETVRGIVLSSEREDFVVGGDLQELHAAQDGDAVRRIVAPLNQALRLLEKGGKPVVAAMPGSALGGGLELALACQERVVAQNPKARFGFPEVTLGLMPGAGGTQRLPRLLGIAAAAPLLLEGVRLDVLAALELGLVDQVVAPAELMEAAKQRVLAHQETSQRWDRKGFRLPGFAVHSPAGRAFFGAAWARLRRSSGGNNRAAESILQAMHDGLSRSIDPGLQIELRLFSALAAGLEAKSKVRTLFTGVNRARSMKARPMGPVFTPVQKLAVLGAGVMGRGVAQSAAIAGIDVVLLDMDEAGAQRAHASIATQLQRAAEKGRLKEDPARVMARIRSSARYEEIAHADFVIEAVFERADVKHEVLRRAAQVVAAGTPLASNTSTMPIDGLAAAVSQPERVIGMHFFSPVDRMPLVEVIRGAQTDEPTLARAMDLLKQLAKTPVVVNDGLGFFTSRVVTTYTSETLTMIGEGVPAQVIDNVTMNEGFALGVASLVELTTYPLLADIFRSMRGDGRRIANEGLQAEQTVARLLEAGRHGKAAGAGVYDYAEGVRRVWPGLAQLFPSSGEPDPETIRQRLFHVQALEAVRCLEDGVLLTPLDGDVAAVLGWGYPSHLGGPFAYIDRIGVRNFIKECEALGEHHGGRFAVPASLMAMAERGECFYPSTAS